MAITLTAQEKLVSKFINRYEIYGFGYDNLYPQNSILLADNSPSLEACLKIFRKFIFGHGMEGVFWKMPVNVFGLKTDQFLRRLIDSYSVHKGFAVNVIYNGVGEVIGLIPLKFENIRLGKADDRGIIKKVAYYKDWKGRIQSRDMVWYDVYNPDLSIIYEQAARSGGFQNWNGQVLYYGENGDLEYPKNSFHSNIENAATDNLVKNGKNANVSTNFMGSHVMQLPFTFDEIADQINSASNSERKVDSQDVEKQFKEKITKFQSADNTGKIMLLENGFKDKDGNMVEIKIQKFDLQNYDKINEHTEKSIYDSLRRNYLIPPILLQEVSAGFSTEIFNDAYNYYNHITNYDRLIFEETFTELFSRWKDPLDVNFEIQKLSYL